MLVVLGQAASPHGVTVGRTSGLVGVSGTVVTGGVVSTVRVGATLGAGVSVGAVVEVSGVVELDAVALVVVVSTGAGGVSMYAGSFEVRFTLGGVRTGASTILLTVGAEGASGCSAA